MNFKNQQRTIRRNVSWLVTLFVLAILVNASIGYVFIHFSFPGTRGGPMFDLGDPGRQRLLVFSFGVTLLLTLGTAIVQFFRFSSSGDYLAQSMGADAIAPDTTQTVDRRLMNVVEEISVASGVPVPMVFVMREQPGINAFVFGSSPQNAVLCVTQGCLDRFDRDELQAVIAHEYGHLLNNDMAFNRKVIAYLSGLVVLREWGLRALGRRKGAPVALPLLFIGTFGYFFSLIISRAVSRQREFLADAFSVQFTRNPSALANALRKILWNEPGSVIRHPKTAAIAPLLFADGTRASWLSTHPSLEERISRIDPIAGPDPQGSRVESGANAAFSSLPSSMHLSYAGAFMRKVPEGVLHACRDLRGAQTVVRSFFAPPGSRGLAPFEALASDVRAMGRTARLPLVQLCLPTLRSLPEDEFSRFRQGLLEDLRADEKIDLNEWMLATLVSQARSHDRPREVRYRSLDGLKPQVRTLFCALASISKDSASSEALDAALSAIHVSFRFEIGPCTVEEVHRATQSLAHASASIRTDLLQALLAYVLHDRIVTIEEIEFLRTIATVFEIPAPPIPPERLSLVTFR